MASSWIETVVSHVEAHARECKGAAAPIVCSSGISPSGAIHLGNLREIMTVHLVAEELRRRGGNVEHIHVWDDFDRLRKVPAGMPANLEASVGCPVSEIPDPFGEYESYAARYISEFEHGLARLGVQPRCVLQSVAYRSGVYTAQITAAMAQRGAIFDVLAQYQTRDGQQASSSDRRQDYYPYRPYCEACRKDTTTVTSYDEATTLHYSCEFCGYAGAYALDDKVDGKLVWKVDWPMRWSAYQVDRMLRQPRNSNTRNAPSSSHSIPSSAGATLGRDCPPCSLRSGKSRYVHS